MEGFVSRRVEPNPGVYAALTEEQFNESAVEYDGIKLVGSEEGDYVWAYGHIDPAAFAKAADRLYVEYFGALDHEPFDPNHQVRHVQAVRRSSSASEWRISWEPRFLDHGERFPLTMLEVEG